MSMFNSDIPPTWLNIYVFKLNINIFNYLELHNYLRKLLLAPQEMFHPLKTPDCLKPCQKLFWLSLLCLRVLVPTEGQSRMQCIFVIPVLPLGGLVLLLWVLTWVFTWESWLIIFMEVSIMFISIYIVNLTKISRHKLKS